MFFGRDSELDRLASLCPTVEVNGYFDAIIPFRRLLGL